MRIFSPVTRPRVFDNPTFNYLLHEIILFMHETSHRVFHNINEMINCFRSIEFELSKIGSDLHRIFMRLFNHFASAINTDPGLIIDVLFTLSSDISNSSSHSTNTNNITTLPSSNSIFTFGPSMVIDVPFTMQNYTQFSPPMIEFEPHDVGTPFYNQTMEAFGLFTISNISTQFSTNNTITSTSIGTSTFDFDNDMPVTMSLSLKTYVDFQSHSILFNNNYYYTTIITTKKYNIHDNNVLKEKEAEFSKNNGNYNDSNINRLKILIFANYLLCWLYILIMSYPNLPEGTYNLGIEKMIYNTQINIYTIIPILGTMLIR